MNTKTKKSFTLGMAVIGSYLFYKQDAGINIFIFTIISAFALMYLHKQKGYKTLSLAILPSLLSSIFIVWYPQLFTRMIWVLGYLLMWSRMLPTPYPIVTLFQGLVSICESPIRLLKKGEIQPKTKATGQHKNIIYIITTTIVLVFILLYIKSNPVFSKLFSNIDLSFIEFGFLMTIIGLYLLLNSLVTINANKKIQGLNSIKSTITKTTITQRDQQEYLIAKLSIGTIGIILFIANITDLIVIITGKLLEGITYSEYVHQGFNTLIFTLGLAIAIIIYFFRGQLNFHHHLKVIKRSGSFWILQNILLALITAYKNMLYVEAYGLTYKRIAVFLALICIIIALVLSLKKLYQPHTNWVYYNKLALNAFICLLFMSFIPMDRIITRYNLSYSETRDIPYILSLSKPNLKLIENLMNEKDELYSENAMILNNKIFDLNQKASNNNWQSWNFYIDSYKRAQ